ncbi:MAG: sigma-70 family RNA polymerase sigma factor [Balneolaceae bacterium]
MNAIRSNHREKVRDESLMKRFQEGDEQAFSELVNRYQDRLHNFLFRYTRNRQDCEDLAQETFIRVYRKRDSYKPIARFSTWMYTIALNLARSEFRKQKKMQLVSIHEDPADSDSREMVFESVEVQPDRALENKMDMERLEDALDQLTEEYRDAVVLRDIQQLSYEEIAEITETPMGTVKSRINRGRIQIQELMVK